LARELALKALYQHDLLGGRSPEELRAFCVESARPEVVQLAMLLVTDCIEKQEALDEVIRRTAEHWELERMATSDRNILRLGVYELLFKQDTPPKVAINEAIELAKKYSTENSPTFVNGILDRIYTTRVAAAPCAHPQASQAEGGPGEPADAQSQATVAERPDPRGRVDLHVHSTASDGSMAPEELPVLAAEAGLAALALTDHDSVEGIAAAADAAAAVGIELVSGVELTGYAPSPTGSADIEVHIAGVFVDACSPALLETLRGLRMVRVERMHSMVRKLNELGIAVEMEAVLERARGGAVGRAHLAQEMVARGYCRSLSEVFERYIGPGCPAYVPKEKLTPPQAIAIIKEAGGCSVFCHPGLTPGLEDYIEGLVKEGLDALEVYYPLHTLEDERRFLEMAQRLDLAVTGGSDFHSAAKPSIQIGQETVSLVELETLRKRAACAPHRHGGL